MKKFCIVRVLKDAPEFQKPILVLTTFTFNHVSSKTNFVKIMPPPYTQDDLEYLETGKACTRLANFSMCYS